MSPAPRKANVWRMMAVLGGIAVASGALMAWVNALTAPRIAEAESAARVQAVADVAPGARYDNSPVDDARAMQLPDGTEAIVYPLVLEGRFTGAAVESYSLDGFDGEVRVMYGFDPEGTITGYTVLRQTETPGLGAKMQEWFRDPTGRRTIIGLNPDRANLTVSKDGGDVDAITAATISSRAFLASARSARQALDLYLATTSSAQ